MLIQTQTEFVNSLLMRA